MSPHPDDAHALAGQAFAEAVAIMARLRGPDGCPWDREQNFDSIRKYTLEETYEVFDAIERRDWNHLKDELGDLLLQVLFYSQMAAEPGYFTVAEVVEGLNRKLIRRHPHVFGDEASAAAGNSAPSGMKTAGIDATQVLRNWDQIKQAEKANISGQNGAKIDQNSSILDSIPRSFPALMEAAKIGSKAAKTGFDWPDVEGVFSKLQEEIAELQEEIAQSTHEGSERNTNISGELGDIIFTTVNLSRHLGVDPEMALRQTNQKFRRRFAAMEAATDLPLSQQSSDRLESLWFDAKVAETAPPSQEQK